MIVLNKFRLMTLLCIPFIDYILCIWICIIRRWRKLVRFLRREFPLIWMVLIRIRIWSTRWTKRWFSRLFKFIRLAVVLVCLINSCWFKKWLPFPICFISITPFRFRWMWFLRLSFKLTKFSWSNLRMIMIIINNLANFLLNSIT